MGDRSFSGTVRQLLDLFEAALGTDPRWQFYRRTILRLMNNLKREHDETLARTSSSRTNGKNWAASDRDLESLKMRILNIKPLTLEEKSV